MRNVRSIRRASAAVAAFAALVVAAGCGNDGSEHTGGHTNPTTPAAASTSASPGAQHNTADVTFAQEMIPHHQQAVEMAELAETRASDPEVKSLAAKIKQAQEPEIQQLTTWLGQWGVLMPSAMPSTSGGAHGGHGDMTGMMSEQDMRDLQAATGAEFDRTFLDMMIRHHQGAVQMARTEQQQGQNQPAKDLARQIETSQNDEIATMQALLGNK